VRKEQAYFVVESEEAVVLQDNHAHGGEVCGEPALRPILPEECIRGGCGGIVEFIGEIT
jgi:hypothetical protein